MTTHELKSTVEAFQAVVCLCKHAEVRFDDRGYAEGDTLHLREWDGYTYTGNDCYVEVTHIQRGYGLPNKLVVLSFDLL